MALRREKVETRREPSKRSYEGGRRGLFLPAHPEPAETGSFPVAWYVDRLRNEHARCSSVSAFAAEAFMDNPGHGLCQRAPSKL